MSKKQQDFIVKLRAYATENQLEIVDERNIDYGSQFKLSNGIDTCLVNIYQSGKVTFGGKNTSFRQQVEEWSNLQQAVASQQPVEAGMGRTTRYIVDPDKFDRIRSVLAQIPAEIIWHEEDPDSAQVYRADLRANKDRVVVTQYRTKTLLVQGRLSPLFDEICRQLDEKLVQSTYDRATRYIPEEQRDVTLAKMSQPEAELEAWNWLNTQLSQSIIQFLDKHDQDTLLSGAMIFHAVKSLNLKLPDYSTLVMPFARAYEGFLIKIFVHIGLADSQQIKQSVQAISVGKWLDQLPDYIVDIRRHGHIVSDLKTAWEGTRHLMIHSDPVRQLSISELAKAEYEIGGVLIRAFERGYKNFVENPIQLKSPEKVAERTALRTQSGKPKPAKPSKKEEEALNITVNNEADLLARLQAEGYLVEEYKDSRHGQKWRVTSEKLQIFCPQKPGNKIIVKGEGREAFKEWYERKIISAYSEAASKLIIIPHIGADEAGKGDYFGPLVAAAVYVDEISALDLIRWGVKDSKSLSDSRISEFALKIRERCPNIVRILLPPEYNETYQHHQNLNQLLAELHAEVIGKLVSQTSCHEVLVDQFAASEILAGVVKKYDPTIKLEQRTKAEADVAVAAASILARESFITVIEDYRVKTSMEIPLGSSSPKVIEIGQAIVQKWGRKGLERIAKVDFKTTQKILTNQSK